MIYYYYNMKVWSIIYVLNVLFFQTLYTYPENFRAYKALIAAQYAGSNVKVEQNFVFGETNKQDGFLKKFPTGKVSNIIFACKYRQKWG